MDCVFQIVPVLIQRGALFRVDAIGIVTGEVFSLQMKAFLFLKMTKLFY